MAKKTVNVRMDVEMLAELQRISAEATITRNKDEKRYWNTIVGVQDIAREAIAHYISQLNRKVN